MRADERAAQARNEREEKFRQTLKSGAKTVLSAVPGIASGAMASRLLPFLSEHIPASIAIKGISKISPQIGKFLQSGLDSGLDIKEGLNFLRGKITEIEQPEETKEQKAMNEMLQGIGKMKESLDELAKPPEEKNIIQQYSPELFEFIKNQMVKKQMPILEAGALALSDPKFKTVIQQMEKDHKANWTSILRAAFGAEEEQPPQRKLGALGQAILSGQPLPGTQLAQPAQPAQPAQAQGTDRLIAVLQKLQQARGKK